MALNLVIKLKKGLNKYREPLETPVGFPEVPRRKLLIPYYVTNYKNAIFSMG
jgi:hypothetical protein